MSDEESGKGVGVAGIVFTIAIVALIFLSPDAWRERLHRLPAWAVPAAIFGVPLAFWLVPWLFGRVFGTPPAVAAREIDRGLRETYAGVHVRRIVDERAIADAGLDVRFYRAATAEFERLGFRRLEDVVDETAMAATPGARAVIRTFARDDGTAAAAAYDVRFVGRMRLLQWVGVLPRDLRCVEVETELNDGTFVCTSSAFTASKASEFPGVSRRFLPHGTSVPDVVAAHAEHLRDATAARPGIGPRSCRSFADVCAAQDRLDAIKTRHRNSSAYDVVRAFERVAGGPLEGVDRELADEAARLHGDRRRG